jgi:hypothetical protein
MMVVASFGTWDGWPALVSIGTLLLAASTGALALLTRRSVDGSQQQIAISRQELEILDADRRATGGGAGRTQRDRGHPAPRGRSRGRSSPRPDAANAGAFALGRRLECFERNYLAPVSGALAAVGVDLDGGRTHRVSCSA